MVETLKEDARPETGSGALAGLDKGLKKGLQPEGSTIRRMFADVAPRYDFLNHTLSGGVDRLWRRHTVSRALEPFGDAKDARVLDLCSGTGDLALAFAAKGSSVIGADFCPEMLEIGEQKRRGAKGGLCLGFLAADAQALPFAEDQFDLATVAFGIRNVQDPECGLAEMRRVVKPGGKVYVLEFSRPRTPILGPAYMWYFRHVLPRLGSWLSRGSRDSKAYDYLPESVLEFPDREAFLDLMRAAGLTDCSYRLLSFGIAALYEGRVLGQERVQGDS